MKRVRVKNKEELMVVLEDAIENYGPAVDLNHIDTSQVTDMSNLFGTFAAKILQIDEYVLLRFNGDISQWDVSSVTDFSLMFSGVRDFNQDISGWDVSAGVNFGGMFSGAKTFNQDIGGWDVSNGVHFRSMFNYADVFNQDIGGWDVSNGRNFASMFYGAKEFNQDIGGWDVYNGRDFSFMFREAKSFNQNLDGWDVSPGSDVDYMFSFSGMESLPLWWDNLGDGAKEKYADGGVDESATIEEDSGRDVLGSPSLYDASPAVRLSRALENLEKSRDEEGYFDQGALDLAQEALEDLQGRGQDKKGLPKDMAKKALDMFKTGRWNN